RSMIPRSALVSAWNQTPFRSDFLRALKSSSFAVRHPSSASNPLLILWRFDGGNVVTGGSSIGQGSRTSIKRIGIFSFLYSRRLFRGGISMQDPLGTALLAAGRFDLCKFINVSEGGNRSNRHKPHF